MAHKCLKCDRHIANKHKNKICLYCRLGEPPYIKLEATNKDKLGGKL